MKIIYCIHSVYNPGGMERVMINKINYLVSKYHHEILIVTTDQNGRPPFYPIDESVRMIDLEINYSQDNGKSAAGKITGYLRRRKMHRRKLTQLLYSERADIVVSLFPSESSFIPDIKDGSKKVLELHFNKFFRLQYNRSGILGRIDRWRTHMDDALVRRFDSFVVLSEEDRQYWGDVPNMTVISNAALIPEGHVSNVEQKRVIAVGRLDYQKGFDRLIEVWRKVMVHPQFADWRLDIFGQGEWKEMLESRIVEYGLEHSCRINAPTKDIMSEYENSSILVMSSNYEGFPMVMIEAMACGLPAVSFDFKCGPKDIIHHNENGLLVKNGDLQGLAEALMKLMSDDHLRQNMSVKARDVVKEYSQERIMGQWSSLFSQLISGNKVPMHC